MNRGGSGDRTCCVTNHKGPLSYGSAGADILTRPVRPHAPPRSTRADLALGVDRVRCAAWSQRTQTPSNAPTPTINAEPSGTASGQVRRRTRPSATRRYLEQRKILGT